VHGRDTGICVLDSSQLLFASLGLFSWSLPIDDPRTRYAPTTTNGISDIVPEHASADRARVKSARIRLGYFDMTAEAEGVRDLCKFRDVGDGTRAGGARN